MDLTQPDLPPRRRLIASLTEYDLAVDALLHSALSDISIFDPDCAQLRLNSLKRSQSLQRLLHLGGSQRVNIVVHRADHIERSAPRLLELLRLYPERLSIRVTSCEARHAQDCFVIADAADCVRRPVAAQPRGVCIENDVQEVSLQRERFAQLLAATDTIVQAASLGL